LRPNIQDSSSEKYYKNALSSALEKFRKDQEKQETLFTRIRTKVPQSARCKQRGIGRIIINLANKDGPVITTYTERR